jgi:hypothetical protein
MRRAFVHTKSDDAKACNQTLNTQLIYVIFYTPQQAHRAYCGACAHNITYEQLADAVEAKDNEPLGVHLSKESSASFWKLEILHQRGTEATGFVNVQKNIVISITIKTY